MMMQKGFMLAAVLLVNISLSGSGWAFAAENGPYPFMDLWIDQPKTVQAKVTEESNGSVTFNGFVQISPFTVERVVVNLSGMVDSGWLCVIYPSLMVITNSSNRPFNATVRVPQATSSDIIGNLKVTAIGIGGGYNMTGWTCATVTVAPYYRFSIVSDGPILEIMPGDVINFNYKIHNLGNSADSYEFTIANSKELKDAGWTVKLSTNSVQGVARNQTILVTVNVKSPGFKSWDLSINQPNLILLNVSSLGSKNSDIPITVAMPVWISVKGTNNNLIVMIIILVAVGITLVSIFLHSRKKR